MLVDQDAALKRRVLLLGAEQEKASPNARCARARRDDQLLT